MSRKVMRTIGDVRNEIREDLLSTQPLLTDGYTYGNVNDVKETLGDGLPDAEELEEQVDMPKGKAESKKPGSCGWK